MSSRGSPPEAVLARMLSGIGNQTLKLDPGSRPRLAELAGTCVRFDVIPPSLPSAGTPEPRSITLKVRPDGLDLEAGSTAQAHVVVTGTLPDIIGSFLAARTDPSHTGSLRIDGDEAQLQALADLFRALEPDVAEPLAGLVGREMADGLVGFAEAGIALLKSAAESVSSGVRQEATRVWVDNPAFQTLMDRFDDLRLRVDRLDARVRLRETEAEAQATAESGKETS